MTSMKHLFHHTSKAPFVRADGSADMAAGESSLLALNFSPWSHAWVSDAESRAFFGLDDFPQL